MFGENLDARKIAETINTLNKYGDILTHDRKPPENPGPPSGMKCSCGGNLCFDSFRDRSMKSWNIATTIIPKPRSRRKSNREWSLKKRIAKKQKKAWLRKVGLVAGIGVPLIGRNKLTCEKCGRIDGWYSAVARNIIQIEPLPQGALPVYDKNIDVADVLLKGE